MKRVTQHHQQQRLNPVCNLVVLVPTHYQSLWGLNMITDTFVNSAGFLTNMELFRLLFEYLAHGEAQKIQLQFYSLP